MNDGARQMTDFIVFLIVTVTKYCVTLAKQMSHRVFLFENTGFFANNIGIQTHTHTD